MEESRVPVTVTVEGFYVTSPSSDEEERQAECVEAAEEIASDVGSRLSSCGTSCIGGRVVVVIEGVGGTSDER